MTDGVDTSQAHRDNLASTIDNFVTDVKKKTRKKSLKVIGVSASVVTVAVVMILLKKDKTNTSVYLQTLEKYERLLVDHLVLQEKYISLAESYLEVTEKVLETFDKKVVS